MARIWTFAIAMTVALGCAKKKEQQPEPAPASSAPLADVRPNVATGASVEVTAQKLYLDYVENEVGADARYRGKVLKVAGIVERVTKGALGDSYLVLRTSGRDVRVQANFADEAALVPLKAGQEIALLCIGEGKQLAALMLADCVLAPVLDEAGRP